jgi:hypothetical protein
MPLLQEKLYLLEKPWSEFMSIHPKGLQVDAHQTRERLLSFEFE